MRRKSIWRRIKWKNVLATVFIIAAVIVSVTGVYYELRHKPVVTYTMTAKKGDTLWTLCDKIDNEYSTGYLVWEAMQQNHIHNAYELQPGQKIMIVLPEK